MGYSTDFIGHIDVQPALNRHEQQYLSAFSSSMRTLPRPSIYDVPGNPAAEEFDTEQMFNAMAAYGVEQKAPTGMWCGWAPGWSGASIAFDGREKFNQPIEWLRFLIDHFLRPEALAASSGLSYFDLFTFDHVLDGVVAGCRRDTSELYLIDVADNVVTRTVIRPGDPQPWDIPPLPYQAENDRIVQRRHTRRRATTTATRRSLGAG